MLNGVPRILIIRLSAIGDVVRVLPALHALRDRYPNAQIDWAIEPKSRDIVEDHPDLDRVLVFERGESSRTGARSFLRFCRQIRQNRYDIVIDFHGIFKSGLIAWFSRAPKRYGFARPRSREFSFLGTNHRVRLVSRHMNRIDENLEICKALEARRHHLDVTIHVRDHIIEETGAYFEEAFMAGKRVVTVHAPVDRPEKQWPLEHFATLSDMLLADGRFEVLLTWGPGQRQTVESVAAKCRRKPTVAPETPGLKHYAGMVQHTDLYFGGDTGPMHIASAMGVPVVAVFGGTEAAKHAPLRQPSVVLYAGPKPFPAKMPLATAEAALRAVTPEMAYDACIGLLAGEKPAQPPLPEAD